MRLRAAAQPARLTASASRSMRSASFSLRSFSRTFLLTFGLATGEEGRCGEEGLRWDSVAQEKRAKSAPK